MSMAIHEQIDVSLAVVGATQRETNHKLLQPILSDLIAYGLNIKQLHWNVVGASFRPIHQHLDDIYDDVQVAIDTVAERLTATGHSPNGTLTGVSGETEIPDVPGGFIQDDEVLLLASERTRELVGLIRTRMASIEEVDTVSADVLHQVVATLEKHHWMIQAQRL